MVVGIRSRVSQVKITEIPYFSFSENCFFFNHTVFTQTFHFFAGHGMPLRVIHIDRTVSILISLSFSLT